MNYEQYLVDVKNGIVTDQGNCPVTPLLQNIANATLSNVLKELEEDGFIKRVQFNEIPPHVEYSFTEKGRDLMPIFYQIMVWGFKHEND